MDRQFSSGGKTLSERAAQTIRQYIVDNEMVAGDKLPNEFELAKICEVSRSTMREAIKILAFEGMVEVMRGSGTYILEKKTSKQDDPMGLREGTDSVKKALEFFELRLMLEPEIASLAAVYATYKDCQRLQELEEQMREEKDEEDYLQCDIAFHIQIAKCTKNQVIASLMEIVADGILTFAEITKMIRREQMMCCHKQIADAIAAGDTVGAKCSMIGHLGDIRQVILEEMEKKEK